MLEKITEILLEYGVREDISTYLSYAILILMIAVISFLANLITKKVVLRIVSHYIKNNQFTWDNIMLERKVFQRLSHIVPAVIIYLFGGIFPPENLLWFHRGAIAYIIFVVILVVDATLNALDDIYNSYEISKIRPIKSYIQVVKIFSFIIGAILIISNIIGESPFYLLGGIGAITAVLMLVFKDSILGLVAGVQLTANDMVRIGDWIEMPKYGADGDVIEISLNVVKIRNFDRTITTIPTYALISDSFKNWRGMKESGGRRIMRSINIDTESISFCSDKMLEKFKKIHYIKEYIISKQKEIEDHNKKNNIDNEIPVNGRRLTNIGVFRVYIDNYLKNHPKVHKDMLRIVRQLKPGENGVPLEVYVFTNDTNWINYEGVQSDIFDHILASVPEFGLRLFQNPTGYDIRSGIGGIKYNEF